MVTQEQAGRRARRGLAGRTGSLLKEIAIVVIGALSVSTALRAFVAQPFVIPSGSMENTLQEQDKVVVQKITDISRGDIVVFVDPGSWLSSSYGAKDRTAVGEALEVIGLLPDSSSQHLIKRVIGMPGDTVTCCDTQQRITVNDTPWQQEDYLYRDATGQPVAPADVPFTVVVPADRIFVMGDHRNDSSDSRCHLGDTPVHGGPQGSEAFVPVSNVVGPAFLIAAPFDRFTRLTVPNTFDAVPDPRAPPPQEAIIKPIGVGC